jgi:hypothetical protein
MTSVSTKRSIGAALAAMVCCGALAAGVQAKGGVDAIRTASSPATCTTAGAGSVGFNKSGARVTLDASVAGVVAGSPWHVVVTDSVAGVVAQAAVPATTSSWSSFVNYTTQKGTRAIVVTMTSDNGANTCTATLTYRA